MQDYLYSDWTKPYYDALCRSRQRSPMMIRETVEQKGQIDSVTNVHRKYLLYSSESRCVRLYQEKVIKYMKPVRRFRSDNVWRRRSNPMEKQASRSEMPHYEECYNPRPAHRPCSEEHFYPREYVKARSTKSRSCHSYLDMRLSPDLTSPRFVRPCKVDKHESEKIGRITHRKLPALKMIALCEKPLSRDGSRTYMDEFKLFLNHYILEKQSQRLEGSTILMDTLSLILSTISPLINKTLYIIWRIKSIADKVIHLYIDYSV